MAGEPTGPHPVPRRADESTGSHAAVTLSEPPISAHGLSWKAAFSVVSILVTLAGSVATYFYTHAEAEADARARHREVVARLDRIEDDVAAAALWRAQTETELHQHEMTVARMQVRFDAFERELEKMERRRGTRSAQ